MREALNMQSNQTTADMLTDCSIDAIIAIGANREIITWNAAAETIYGKTREQVIGKQFTEVMVHLEEDKESQHAVDLAFHGFKSFVPANKLFAHRSHAENHYIPLKEKNGELKGVMNIVHDVSHRIKNEQLLEKLNEELEVNNRRLETTSKELASFTYISANNIRKPIKGLYTDIEFLIRSEANRLSDSGKATFRRIQASLNRMNLLLDDMLNLAEISVLKRPETEVCIDDVVLKVKEKLAKKISEKNANIHILDLCTIHGHLGQLEILFTQLIDNALKFNESPTPYVNIGCKETLEPDVDGKVKKFYCVNVADNGIGIAEGDIARVFTMFEKLNESNRYRGSGVGLTIAEKIMEAHGGFIRIFSKPGSGTDVRCYFPRIENNRQ